MVSSRLLLYREELLEERRGLPLVAWLRVIFQYRLTGTMDDLYAFKFKPFC
jgi:hypothetical protein